MLVDTEYFTSSGSWPLHNTFPPVKGVRVISLTVTFFTLSLRTGRGDRERCQCPTLPDEVPNAFHFTEVFSLFFRFLFFVFSFLINFDKASTPPQP